VIRSLEHLQAAQQYGDEHQLPVARFLAIIPNMYKKEVVQDQNLEFLQEQYGAVNVLTPIRQRTAWRQAAQLSTPIFTFDAKSQAAREALRFVAEVEERLQ
jgi:cellulose biosynthesis protein BcsQ